MKKKIENNFEKERIQLLTERQYLDKELAGLEVVIQTQVRKNEIQERIKEIENRLLWKCIVSE